MGFAVDEQLEVLGDIPTAVWDEIGHHDRWTWEAPFLTFAQIMARGGATARLGHSQQMTWLQALDTVPPHGKVLVISHGRIIEAGVVACFPGAEFATWGAPFRHTEGVRLDYTDGQFTAVEFLRVPSS